MPSPNGLFALGSAVAWGGGDFSGGMGVRQIGGDIGLALRFVMFAHGMSAVMLAVLLVAMHGWALPIGGPTAWGLVAGVAAGLSITVFYMALSRGDMGVSAALSGILAAAIPALVSTWIEGAPSMMRVVGFVLAAASIWAIAAGSPEIPVEDARPALSSTFWLAIAGGIGFGIYFVALRMANPLGIVMPMVLARAASITTCGLLALGVMLFSRRKSTGASVLAAWPWALGVALMDTGGNMLFVAATRAGRLDVAAVLASLYPASTILLAAWRLHEKPSRRQLGGMALALVAVVMITV